MEGSGEKSGAKKVLLYGCLGCAGLIGLFVLMAGGVAGLAFVRARSEQVEQHNLARQLPPADAPSPASETPGGPDAGAPAEPRRTLTQTASTTQPGRLVLDLRQAGFHIEPASSGQPLTIDARFDERAYRLEEGFEAPGDAAWTYRVGFSRTGSGLVTGLKELFGGTRPEVKIYLPRDVPMRLELTLQEGGAEVELGGLWLTSAQIDFEKGGFDLDIDEPLPEPMERLIIRGRMGGFDASSLGNASPRVLEISGSMGGMDVDLRGAWRRDAEVTVTHSMGGAAVRLPTDVGVERIQGPINPRPAEAGRPTLRLAVSGSMGEVTIIQ